MQGGGTNMWIAEYLALVDMQTNRMPPFLGLSAMSRQTLTEIIKYVGPADIETSRMIDTIMAIIECVKTN